MPRACRPSARWCRSRSPPRSCSPSAASSSSVSISNVEALAAQLAARSREVFSVRSRAADLACGCRRCSRQSGRHAVDGRCRFRPALASNGSRAPRRAPLRSTRRHRVAHLMYKWRGEPLSVYVLQQRVDARRRRRAVRRDGRAGSGDVVARRPHLRGRRSRHSRRELEPVVRLREGARPLDRTRRRRCDEESDGSLRRPPRSRWRIAGRGCR